MPIYDYTCSACHRTTEFIHGINDHGPRFCPECGAEGTMTKAFVTPAIHFKGSGWAKKDRGSTARASAKKRDEGGSSGESTTGTSSGAATSTDSAKPDTSKSSDTKPSAGAAD